MFSQTSAQLKRAKKMFSDQDFSSAITLYKEILNKDEKNVEALSQISLCFRKLRMINDLEVHLLKLVETGEVEPQYYLFLAEALLMKGKYDIAKQWANKYLSLNPNEVRAKNILQSCQEPTILSLRSTTDFYKVNPVQEINSKFDEFAPLFFVANEKQYLSFVSTRNTEMGNIPVQIVKDNLTGAGFTKLFQSEFKVVDPNQFVFSYSSPKEYTQLIKNSLKHVGPLTFNPNLTEMYFSASDLDNKATGEDGLLKVKIYRSEKNAEGTWSKPLGLFFNDEEFSVKHPSLNEEGTALYFSSDMPGGFGGFDLYVSFLENGIWSMPQNLGATINTEGDEAFPHITGYGTDVTLYYSSTGLVGLGGMDIYYTKDNFGTWTEPINMGAPINSTFDDFSFCQSQDKTYGFFSSNRSLADLTDSTFSTGDDIFVFNKLAVPVEVLVYDENTQMPLENAEIYTYCNPTQILKTNADGKAYLEVSLFNSCDFAAEKEGYRPASLRFNPAKDLKKEESTVISIPLNISRVFDVSGTVVDGKNKQPVSEALVRLKSSCDGEVTETSIITDSKGNYEFLGIKENCDYQIIVSKEGYAKASTTFTTRGDEEMVLVNLAINCIGGEDCPHNCPPGAKPTGKTDAEGNYECLDAKGNRSYIDENGNLVYTIDKNGNRTDYNLKIGPARLVHIFYDYDKANIREDAYIGLDTLLNLLQSFPKASVKITSHTDSRGSRNYNKSLSNRRAEAVVRYLIANGIEKRRLKAQGMGEEVMLNDCYDGYECDETQHQENRRTEFVILNLDDSGVDYKSQKDMRGVRIDRCKNCGPEEKNKNR